MKAADRIIVALDFPTLDPALRLIDSLGDSISFYKVGLELLMAEGAPKVVKALHDRGLHVFLDGKFHDIPNTIESASRETAKLEVALFNVHASNGMASMKAAAKAKGKSKAIAVTVLTSLTEEDCQAIYSQTTKARVVSFAKEAKAAGLDGVVCSPQELELLAKEPFLTDFLKVTPGVRPKWSATQDQKRIMTPAEALQKGATHLVIGRPITQPPREVGTPRDAALRVLEEVDKAV